MRARSALVVILTLAGCGGSGDGPPGTPAPKITGVYPDNGPPGTAVAIQGTGFSGTTAITFNGTPALYIPGDDKNLSATVPMGATTGPVSVTAPGGTATSAAPFTVPPPFWSSKPAATTESLLAITWSGAQFVAVGGNGEIVTSPDAETWTSRFSSTSQPLFGVAWSGTRYVAVGGGLALLTSDDGATWAFPCITAKQCTPPGGTPPVGCGGDPTAGFHAILWTGAQFVVVGKFLSGTILTSPDGSAGSWVPRSGADLGWTSCSCATCTPTKPSWAVAASPSLYVAAGEGGQYGYWSTSPDGATWTMRAVSSSTITGLVWSGTKFVAVGYGGVIFASADGINWQARASGTLANLYGVAWSGSRFVAVGQAGTTVTSPDGLDWTVEYSGETRDINAVTWAGTRFVAVGYQGLVLTAAP